MQPDFDVVIVGAGFSGLGMAIRLRQEGKRSFIVLEKAASLGGAWRENTYPGCACDIASNLYSFSFAPNPHWSRLFPTQPEIRAYLEDCADSFGVRGDIRFNTALKSAAWDEAAKLWRIAAGAGSTITARAIVAGMGGLHVPNLPRLDGLDAFQGRHWHSARWPADGAPGADLSGKRVAIVGAGASAIQIAPAIAPIVAHLDLYQRTPSWVMPKRDRSVTETEKDFMHHAPALQEWKRRMVYLANEARVPLFLRRGGSPVANNAARAHIARHIADPELRAKVTPDYALGCKRVLISDDYYPTLTRANVSLIASEVRRVTPTGLIAADGQERPADVIVFATGFKPMHIVDDVDITGLGGASLRDTWAGGAEAYLGTAIAGFPNLFLLMGPNSALGHNSMIYMIESQIAFVRDALAVLDRKGAAALCPRVDAQARFNEDVQAKLANTVWGSGCSSWYLSPDGKNRTLWPDFTFRFRARTRRVHLPDFDLIAA